MAELTIRKAEAEDAEIIAALEQVCFEAPWGFQDVVDDVRDNRLSTYIVAEVDGVIAGYIGFWAVAGECQINNVAVAPQHRRSRIGSYMLHTTIEACREAGIDLFTLEVRSGNDPAIRLYEKFGFRRDATRRGYYQDNGEDAILMSLQLAEGPAPEERA